MNREKLVKKLVMVIVLVLVCLLPLIVPNDYWIHVLILIATMILATSSMRAIFRTGEITIGTSGFMLLGGYSSALLTLNLGLSFWITMPLGGLFAAAVAAAIGYPFFRVKGIYFAISTLLLAFVFLYLAGYMKDLTGGWQGLVFDIWPNPITIPGIITLTFDTDTSYYYLAIIIVGLCLFILYRMERARIGLVWGSIREADNLAQSVGVNIMAQKIFIFVVACFFTGIAGALYAFYVHALSPTTTPANVFGFFTSIYCILYMVVGGEGSFFGPIIGTTLFMLIPEFARPLQMYRPLIYGALLILIIFFMPQGLIGLGDYFTIWYRKLLERFRSKVSS
ncbi:MAG: branched-chain amino acid ABC transporter permease [Thermodesulfobacteriota bacterium]|jgi:branched-chain amino acid transport system permease protein